MPLPMNRIRDSGDESFRGHVVQELIINVRQALMPESTAALADARELVHGCETLSVEPVGMRIRVLGVEAVEQVSWVASS